MRTSLRLAFLASSVVVVLIVVWWRFGIRSTPATQTPNKLPRPPATANAPSPERDDSRFTTDLDNLRRENQRLREALDRALTTSGDGVQAKVNRLRGMFAQLPEQAIPEFELATEDDWYAAVYGPLESVEDYRLAMARLRKQAENRFAYKLQPALRAYVDANHEFPQDPMQLKALAGGPINDAMLRRYKIAPASDVPNVKMGGNWIITQASRIDSDYDQYMVIGPDGYGTFTRNNADMGLLVALAKAYIEANGRPPNDPVLLLPYAQTPEQRAAIERVKTQMGPR